MLCYRQQYRPTLAQAYFLQTAMCGFIHQSVVEIQGGPKNYTVRHITSSNNDQFSNFLTLKIRRKVITILPIKISPHFKYVATLPCEISMS